MCFMDTLSNCCGLMDPYGDMPMACGMKASAEIDITETDGNIHVSVVKTPPRDGKLRLPEVLAAIMGSQIGLECAADLGERKPKADVDKTQEDDKMKPQSPPPSKEQGSQPWGEEKPEESDEPKTNAADEGRKEKK